MRMAPSEDDRRQHPRFDVVAQVSVAASDEASVLSCANISAGGVMIQLGRGEMPSVVVGAQVRVRLDLGSDKYGRPLDLDAPAEVVRIDLGGPDRNPGFALMWVSEDPAVARQLAVILEYLHPA